MILVLTLVLTMLPAMAVTALAATINDDKVFLMQSGSGKCTLTSAVMMLRRRAIIDGNANWESITESSIKSAAWLEGVGLNNNFTYAGMTVGTASYSGMSTAAKKSALLAMLDKHPEGVEIYDGSLPHAVLLTDYDAASDTFYCADPGTAAKRIKLSASWNAQNRGSQEAVIANITKIWYITNKSGGGPGLLTVKLDPNGGSCTEANAYVSADGTVSSLPTPTREGYAFLGWYTAASGGTKITSSYKFSDDCTIYAQWKSLPRITLDPNGGSCDTKYVYASADGSTGTLPTPVYDGFRFLGWYDAPAGGNKISSSTIITKDMTVYAQWKDTTIRGECGENLKWSLNEDTGVLRISGSGEMNDYHTADGLEAPWYGYAESIKSVVLGAGVKTVGNYAFAELKGLKSVEIDSELRLLGSGAFYGCTALRELVIYNRAESLVIGQNAFYGCTGLKSVTLDCRSLVLENNAFPSGAKIDYINISGELGSVAANAFSGVSTTIVYPANGTKWGEHKGESFGGSLVWESYDNHVHDYKTTVVAPTCSASGYTIFECKSCSEKFEASYVRQLGHNFVNGVCTVCGAANPFTDIDAQGRHVYFTDAILWAAQNGITNGTTATTFNPDGICTRAQVVTFLWRLAGKPQPSGSVSGFADVKSGAYYTEAVLWAAEKGITTGVDDTHFAPDRTVTRAQFVVFLWRYLDRPVCGGFNPFNDVPSSYFAYSAILWAYENGITSGTSATAFSPAGAATRAQVVTFLYRMNALDK